MNQELKTNFMHKLVWSVLLISQFIYVGVCSLSLGGFTSTIERPVFSMIMLATLCVVLGFMLPALFLKNRPRASNYSEALQSYFVPMLVGLILMETSTVIGLVLSFNLQKNIILPFVFLSIVGFLLSFPTPDRIKKHTKFSV